MVDVSAGTAADPGLGGGVADLVNTQKAGVQNVSIAAQSLKNAFPPATASTSPVSTGINTLGTTGTAVIASNAFRHGLIICNPATTNVFVYVFPSNMTTAPTLSS